MRRYTPLTLTIPARTLASAPVSKTWSLYPGYVRQIRIDLPKGHARLTGVRLVWHGTPVIPFDATTWVVGDDRVFDVNLDVEVDGLGLVVQAFNTDQYSHVVYCYADVDPHHPARLTGIVSHRLAGVPGQATLAQIAALTSPPPPGGQQ